MKVVVITPEYPPRPSGGIGVAVRTLARALVERGHPTWVVVPGPVGEVLDDGVVVRSVEVRHPPRLGWLLVRRALAREVRSLVTRHDADVVASVDWLGMSAGLRADAPVVVHCHGSAAYFAEVLGDHVRPIDRWTERSALRSATAVTAVSRYTAERTAALFDLTTTPTVVPNGLDLTTFSPTPARGQVIAHVGSLVRKKGALDLGPVFSAVIDRHPDARLRIIGRDVPDRRTGAPSTWALAESGFSPAAAAQVENVGPVPHDALPGVLEDATLCLFPSYAEACPMSWIEAMAAGRPIVGYRLPWAEELVDHGLTGWLAPVGDTVAAGRLAADALADPMGVAEAGRAASESAHARFGLDLMVDRTLRVYADAGAGVGP